MKLIYLRPLALSPMNLHSLYTFLSRCKMQFGSGLILCLFSYLALIAALVSPEPDARDIYTDDSQPSLQHINHDSSHQSRRSPHEARGCAGSKVWETNSPRPPHPGGPLPPGEPPRSDRPHPLGGHHAQSGPPHPEPLRSRVVFHQPLVPMRQDRAPLPGRPKAPSRIPPTRPPESLSSGLVSDQDRTPHPIGGPYPPGAPPRGHPTPGAFAWYRPISPAREVCKLQCQSYKERCLSNCICTGPKLDCGNDARRRTPVRDPLYIAHLEGLCGRFCVCSPEQDAE